MAATQKANVPAEASQWETVTDESPTQVKFDKIGDVFTGIKAGKKELEAKDGSTFTIYLFRAQGMTGDGIEDGELCSVTEAFKLKELAKIPDGTLTRIAYVKDVEVGRPQPMRDFTIQTRQ